MTQRPKARFTNAIPWSSFPDRAADVRRLNHQTGYSLIELLVALALSILLLGMVLAIFMSSKNTSLLQEGLTRLQEDGRVAVRIVAHEVRKAGFRKPVWNTPKAGYTPLTSSTVNGADGASDTLQLMYMDDVDCNGTQNTTMDPETSEPQALYKRITFNVDTSENLVWSCDYGATPSNLDSQWSDQVIISNVESFQVLYGVDTDFPPDFSANAWTTASAITPEATVCLQNRYLCESAGLLSELRKGLPVVLKVAILVASPEAAGSDKDTVAHQVLDVSLAAKNDNHLRKVYSTTVNLRNLTL